MSGYDEDPFGRRELELWSQKGIPGALLKASVDQFAYAMGLKNGAVFVFDRAELGDINKYNGWVTITGVDRHGVKAPKNRDDEEYPEEFTFDRGVEIRVSEIAWVADAPFGS